MTKIYTILVCLLSTFILPEAYTQQQFVKGYIYSAETNEPLLGANIFNLAEGNGVSSDEDGFFILALRQSNIKLAVSYIGFQSETLNMILPPDTLLQIYLTPLQNKLEEVVVSGQRTPDQSQHGESVNLPIQELKQIPALLGETDIFRAMALTPGVQTGAEGSVGLFVRGGSPDQNLILFDGTPMYNTSHLFGFLSVFNPDAISNVKLIRGGFPAQFGGRLSSIVEITGKEGNKNAHQQEFSIGLVSSRVLAEGPIQKSKSSYVLAARASYLSLLSLIGKKRYENDQLDEYQSYFMYDLNAKITHELGPKDKLSFSFYNGIDTWGSTYRSSEGIYTFDLNWGGPAVSTRYVRAVGKNAFLRTVVSHNSYSLASTHKFKAPDDSASDFSTTSKINDWIGRLDFDWAISSRWRMILGTEWSRKNVSPSVSNLSNNTDQVLTVGIQSLSWYTDMEWNPTDRFSVLLGARHSNYSIKDGNESFLEPRFRLSYRWPDQQVLQLNYSKMSQPLHLLYSNGAGLPNDIWIPSSKEFPPGFSRQLGLEYGRYFDRLKIEARLGAYYKTMENLVTYRPGIDFQNTEGKNWETLIDGNGSGRSYGVEALIRKNSGRLTGWISYTLSKTERMVPNINFGEWYPFKYDRRHDFAVTGAYAFNEKSMLSATFEFQSGFAITLPESIQLDADNNPVSIYKGRNNARMPVFHKLDLSYSRTKTTAKGHERTLTFGVYNLYGRRNPFYVSPTRIPFINSNDQQSRLIDGRFSSRNLVGILPFVSYSIKFK